jgi:hypothetical protein
MPHSIPYPNADYTEDTQRSFEYASETALAGNTTCKYIKVSALIFWLPWVLTFTGIIDHIPSYVFYASSGLAFSIAIIGITRHNKQSSKNFAYCTRCHSELECERHSSCDFYSCSVCQTYIRGADFS